MRSITLKLFDVFMKLNLVQILSIIRQCAENKNCNSTNFLNGIIPFLKIHYGNRARSITLKSFEVFS